MTLFALDDNAFLEPGAAWIRGERTARFIVQPDAGAAAVMRLQGGAVANTVTLAASGWRTEVALAPNDIRDLPLPADALAPAVLSVTSATGFRSVGAHARQRRRALARRLRAVGRRSRVALPPAQKRVVPPKYKPVNFSAPVSLRTL